jgi:anti-sigma factor RsiW
VASFARLRRIVGRRRRASANALVCRQAVELMTDYLEGAMSAAARARFESHLAGCTACTAYLEQMRLTVSVLGRLDPGSLPTPVLDELVDLYRRHRAG